MLTRCATCNGKGRIFKPFGQVSGRPFRQCGACGGHGFIEVDKYDGVIEQKLEPKQ